MRPTARPQRPGPAPRAALPLAAALLLACSTASDQAGGPSPRRPNFLVIVADDLGPTDLGLLGSEIRTPNIDRLAADGLLLPRFLVSPTCSPTRAMLLTGRGPHAVGLGTMAGEARGPQVGAPGYEGVLSPDVETVATLLRRAGYHTSMAGKWHLGREPHQSPGRRGFERWFATPGGGSTHFAAPLALVPPERAAEFLLDGQPVDLPDGFYTTRSFTDHLIGFIGEAARQERPFFAFAAYTAPHWPLQAPDGWIERQAGAYDEGWDALRASRLAAAVASRLVPASATAPPRNRFTPAWDELTAAERAVESRKMEVYAAMVESLDHHVGRLLGSLEDRGLLDDTVVLFFSDNGPEGNPVGRLEGIGEWVAERFDNSLENIGRRGSYVWTGPGWAQASAAPFRLFKSFPTEGGVRAPAIVRGPLVRRGRSEAVVSVADVAPTLLELAGAPVPVAMTGRSMAAFLAGEAEAVHTADEPFFHEIFGRRAVRRGRFKATWLYPPYGPGAWELFDLAADPGEQHDLAAERPETLASLVADWRAWADDNGVALPGFDAGYALEPAPPGLATGPAGAAAAAAAPVASNPPSETHRAASAAVGSPRLSRPANTDIHRDALGRLLAHRVLGFGHPEGSIAALEAALAAGVAYVEIDTRITADGQVLVYHDAELATLTTVDKPVAEYDLAREGRLVYKEAPHLQVPTLEEFLRAFAEHDSAAELQVDLKDPGDEALHCDLIRAAGVANRAWVISWYPEILMRAHRHAPEIRLGFSHLPVPPPARLLTPVARLLSPPILWLARRLSSNPNIQGVDLYFDNEAPDDARAMDPGRFPIHVLTRLPRGELLNALRASRGAVGMDSRLLTRGYVEAAHAAGLKTFVYSIDDPRRYLKAVLRARPDIIFSDEGAEILRVLSPVGG